MNFIYLKSLYVDRNLTNIIFTLKVVLIKFLNNFKVNSKFLRRKYVTKKFQIILTIFSFINKNCLMIDNKFLLPTVKLKISDSVL